MPMQTASCKSGFWPYRTLFMFRVPHERPVRQKVRVTPEAYSHILISVVFLSAFDCFLFGIGVLHRQPLVDLPLSGVPVSHSKIITQGRLGISALNIDENLHRVRKLAQIGGGLLHSLS